MPTSIYGTLDGYRSGSPRQRAISSALALAIIVLGLLIALTQSGVTSKFTQGQALTTFTVPPETTTKPAGAHGSPRRQRRPVKAAGPPHEQAKAPPRIVISKKTQPAPLDSIPGFLHLSQNDLAAGDIGKMHAAPSGEGGASGKGTYGPGEGPNGMRLYNADWYREPTDAQLSTYLPKSNPGDGWGLIACQTVARYHVDNCQIIGELPAGSGYGRAVLNAAWQFLVLPPRINSEPQVGAWVRIRITYTERGARPN